MNDFKKSINDLDLNQLQELLVELKLYKDLDKKLWSRWRNLYNSLKTWKKTYLVEYFPAISEDLAYEISSKVYTEVFNLKIEKNEIKFVSKESILGWVKVYFGDKVVDLSYQKIEKIITK